MGNSSTRPSDIVKRLRAKKIRVGLPKRAHGLLQPQVTSQVRGVVVGRKREIPAPAFHIDAFGPGNRFKESRFPGAVLPGKNVTRG